MFYINIFKYYCKREKLHKGEEIERKIKINLVRKMEWGENEKLIVKGQDLGVKYIR